MQTAVFRRLILAGLVVALICTASGCTVQTDDNSGTSVRLWSRVDQTSSGYDVIPVTWNLTHNTLRRGASAILHSNDPTMEAGPLAWSDDSPFLVAQQWRPGTGEAVLSAPGSDVSLLNFHLQAQGKPAASGRTGLECTWYSPEDKAFIASGAEFTPLGSSTALDGLNFVMMEYPVDGAGRTTTISVPLPKGFARLEVLYGSGNLVNGFAFAEVQFTGMQQQGVGHLYLLRIVNGTATWLSCGDSRLFGGSLIPGQSASIARVGSLLYFTHSHGKIGCIDTAAAAPVVTAPDALNTMLSTLYDQGPQNAEGPLQAQLGSSNGMLLVSYPKADWSWSITAVDSSGVICGTVEGTSAGLQCVDLEGTKGTLTGVTGITSLPCADLFTQFFLFGVKR